MAIVTGALGSTQRVRSARWGGINEPPATDPQHQREGQPCLIYLHPPSLWCCRRGLHSHDDHRYQ